MSTTTKQSQTIKSKQTKIFRATKMEIAVYITIFIVFIITSYISPQIIIFLFTNPFGIGILLFTIAIICYFNNKLGFGIFAVFIILYVSITLTMKSHDELTSSSKNNKNEGFDNQTQTFKDSYIVLQNGWTEELVNEFLQYESFYNPNYHFDMNIIQQQVKPDEVKEYLKTGIWKWSPEMQNLYKVTISRNPYISFSPGTALNNAQQIYNETAIKEIMAWDTKEGHFILNGAIIGHTKNLPKNINNTLRCSLDGKPEKVENRRVVGYPGIMVENYTPVEPEAIPAILNGFSFIKGPCNPCEILNEKILTYNCPFTLDIGDGGTVSPIWAYLWGLDKPVTEDKSISKTKDKYKAKKVNAKDYQINTNF